MTRRLLVLVATLAALVGVVPVAHAAEPDTGSTTSSAPTLDSATGLRTPVISPRRAPGLLLDGLADRRLADQVAPLLAELPAGSCLVVTEDGRPVLTHHPDLPLVPASTMKLATAAAVEAEVGSDTRLVTSVVAGSSPNDGIVQGDLHLVGGGDPLLTTEGYRFALQDKDLRLTSSLAALADEIAAAGVREVRGGIVGDDGRYDGERWVPSWPERYRRSDTVGPLSALIVNDGNTGYSESPAEPSGVRQPGDPPLLAAATLLTLLEERGIEVTGGAGAGPAPAAGVEVARHESPTVGEILTDLLSYSDNTSAELLVKELDVATGGRGTTEGGTAAVARHLEASGIDLGGAQLVDGSGLDLGNRLTCGQLTGILDSAPATSVVRSGLSVAGEVGTLRLRLDGSPAEGRVRAKTGTLNTVYSLAGYVDTVPGTTLTFAILVNIPPEGAPQVGTGQQDRLVELLATYPEGLDPEVVAPLPVG